MKVLHVYRTYFPDPPGGLQEAIRQISLATKTYGVEPSIFTLSPQPEPRQFDNVEATVFRSRSFGAPASCDIGGYDAFKQFSDLASVTDIIHYHFPWPFADLLHLLVKPTAPAVMTYHSDIVRQRFLKRLYQPMMGRMFREMSAIIATSPTYGNTSEVLLANEFKSKVQTIPLGISRQSYPDEFDTNIFKRLNLPLERSYFLFVGVLRQYKGLQYLIRAAKYVDVPIVIAGTGPERDKLYSLTKELGLNNVIFTGQISDNEKIALIINCVALVLPSHLRSEAFGMVLVEAAMYAKPMISCEVGSGTSYVNLDGKTGFVVSPEDPEALALAMKRMLKKTDLVQQFGQKALQRYENLFSGDALGQAYISLYQKVLEKKEN